MGKSIDPAFAGSKFTRIAFAETLATFYFGSSNIDDSLARYIARAYRDMNRTQRLGPLDGDSRRALRADATDVLRDSILQLVETEPTRAAFDTWHQNTCATLKSTYTNRGVLFTYGQSQKWVNMTLKYVFVALALDVAAPLSLRPYYSCAHLPIDSIVMEALRRHSFAGPMPSSTWSRQDDYGDYIAFQQAIRERYGCGLDAEMALWKPHYEVWGGAE